jgi:hypothetical protein
LEEFSEDDPQIVLNISHVNGEQRGRGENHLSLFLYTQAGMHYVFSLERAWLMV